MGFADLTIYRYLRNGFCVKEKVNLSSNILIRG